MNWFLVGAMVTSASTVFCAVMVAGTWRLPDTTQYKNENWIGMFGMYAFGPSLVITVYWLAQAIAVAVR